MRPYICSRNPPFTARHLSSPSRNRWLVVMGQLCRHGAPVIDQIADQISRDQQLQQEGSTMGGTTTSSGLGSTTLTGLMALGGSVGGSGAGTMAVGCDRCLAMMMAYFELGPSEGGGARVRDSALQVSVFA